MQSPERGHLDICSSLEWPPLPKGERTGWDRLVTGDPIKSPNVDVDHFVCPNHKSKSQPQSDQILVGYADAVKQACTRYRVLRRLARTDGTNVLPTELLLEIMSIVFRGWRYEIGNYYRGTEDMNEAIERLFADHEDLHNLRIIARTAANESVVYTTARLDLDNWDALETLHRSLATHSAPGDVINYENSISIPLLLEEISDYGNELASISRSNEDLNLYERPHEAAQRQAQTKGLRIVTYRFGDYSESQLLRSLRQLEHVEIEGCVSHFINSLIAIKKRRYATRVVLKFTARSNTLITASLHPNQVAIDLLAEMLQGLEEICEHTAARAQYEEDLKGGIMSD
ncbi:hypothetical protein DOTSEDRAFT_29695 [Dothistroma septosporum NZE10]|uniref:Uncharacterized protein n=1 Tax=Dothistroma septosporum (strain NZE10 / CBS 128990) TaxID=675120 RepID=M2YHX9_DOTSN|nr:hypothetical protein DOTSEDRAFT_29695 [Dothistroma septosporum NZE10]